MRLPRILRPWAAAAGAGNGAQEADLAAALAASLALTLAVAATTSAAAGLIVMHLTVGAAVIPAMAHTTRTR